MLKNHYSHERLRAFEWDTLSDRYAFDKTDADLLTPLEVDDEHITASEILDPSLTEPSLVVGFNALTRINSCLTSFPHDQQPLVTCAFDDEDPNPRHLLGRCLCSRNIKSLPPLQVLRHRLQKAWSVCDNVHPILRLRTGVHTLLNPRSSASNDRIRDLQFDIMKVDVHVTGLWSQSTLLETVVALEANTAIDTEPVEQKLNAEQIWEMRQEICQNLLRVLNDIPLDAMLPHGLILVRHTRVHP